jgi:hypothetical protein
MKKTQRKINKTNRKRISKKSRIFKQKGGALSQDEIQILDTLCDRYDAFVWDFDDTIVHYPEKYTKIQKERGLHISLNNHLLYKISNLNIQYRNPNSMILQPNLESPLILLDLFFEPEKFVELVLYLTRKGKKVGIISFGSIANIQTILDQLFKYYGEVSPFTGNIYGSTLRDSPYDFLRKQKVDLMGNFIRKNNLDDLSKILFFDDDYNNSDTLTKKGIQGIALCGYKSDSALVKCSIKPGFTFDVLRKIVETRKMNTFILFDNDNLEALIENLEYNINNEKLPQLPKRLNTSSATPRPPHRRNSVNTSSATPVPPPRPSHRRNSVNTSVAPIAPPRPSHRRNSVNTSVAPIAPPRPPVAPPRPPIAPPRPPPRHSTRA